MSATASYTLGAFAVDQLQFIQQVPASVLAAAAAGELELNRLAREELASRGLDQSGMWIGFERAAQLLPGARGEPRNRSP